MVQGMLTMTLTGQYSRKLFRGLSVGHVFILMLTYVTFWLLNLLGCSWVWLAGIQGKENSWMQSIGQSCEVSFALTLQHPSLSQSVTEWDAGEVGRGQRGVGGHCEGAGKRGKQG